MKSLILLVFVTVSMITTGCSSFETHDLDTTSPVEVNHGFFQAPITQDGRIVNYWDARSKFAEIPEAQSAARASLIYQWIDVATATATVGYIIASDHTGPVFVSVLVGSSGLQFLLQSLSRANLQDAAAIYNKHLFPNRIRRTLISNRSSLR